MRKLELQKKFVNFTPCNALRSHRLYYQNWALLRFALLQVLVIMVMPPSLVMCLFVTLHITPLLSSTQLVWFVPLA